MSRTRLFTAVVLAAAGLNGLRLPADAKGFELGWTPLEAAVRWKGSSGDGYAAAAYRKHAYLADVSTLHSGAESYSEIWFSTNRTGRWQRTLVAKVHDDPDTGGATLPQIAVVPSSGHAVIVVVHPKTDGSELLAFSDRSGAWKPAPLPPPGEGADAFDKPSAPSLAAAGSEAVLAFNAGSKLSDCSAQGGYLFVARLRDDGSPWSRAKNITADYCSPKGGFAKNPVLALSADGKPFIAYQCAGDPNGSPGAMCLRSGDLGGGGESLVETNTPDWGLAPSLYALSVDERGAPHVAYIMNDNNQLRLMSAFEGKDGWRRTRLATGGSSRSADVLSLPPAIAAGPAGDEAVYVGYAKWPLGGSNSQALYLARESSGAWSKPRNFTRSKSSDAAPVLASSEGLLHLFIERDGQTLLWTHEEPIPVLTAAVSQAAGVVEMKGTLAPASVPENVKACLQELGADHQWSACREQSIETRAKDGRASFEASWPKLDAGSYRLRVEAARNDDHLARAGAWSAFVVR